MDVVYNNLVEELKTQCNLCGIKVRSYEFNHFLLEDNVAGFSAHFWPASKHRSFYDPSTNRTYRNFTPKDAVMFVMHKRQKKQKKTLVQKDVDQGKAVTIYTDGGCNKNPGGEGGWGALLMYKDKEKEITGAEFDSTNNRAELMAAIVALESLKRTCSVVLYTDSKYVKNGISSWIFKWERNGWKTSTGKPVKNLELWKRLRRVADRHNVEWCWVKGHSGNVYNDRVDYLATQAIKELLRSNK